jgi:hypothetical protein
MESFTNTFDISFNPTGRPSKKRARLTIILENITTVQAAKEFLWFQHGIHATSISRLD